MSEEEAFLHAKLDTILYLLVSFDTNNRKEREQHWSFIDELVPGLTEEYLTGNRKVSRWGVEQDD